MNSTIHTWHLNEGIIPTVSEVVIMYEANGGVLTRNPTFGFDPLLRRFDLNESSKTLFDRNSVEASIVFSNTVHGESRLLQQTLTKNPSKRAQLSIFTRNFSKVIFFVAPHMRTLKPLPYP